MFFWSVFRKQPDKEDIADQSFISVLFWLLGRRSVLYQYMCPRYTRGLQFLKFVLANTKTTILGLNLWNFHRCLRFSLFFRPANNKKNLWYPSLIWSYAQKSLLNSVSQPMCRGVFQVCRHFLKQSRECQEKALFWGALFWSLLTIQCAPKMF